MTDNEQDGALYFGRVMHRRLRPVAHRFDYRVFSMLIDLDRVDRLSRRLRWFSRGAFNLFSFHDRDYGGGENDDLSVYVRAVLRAAGLPHQGRIRLLCYPRMLGYAFNPLAVYYCEDAAGRLAAILYEVRNTFGGRHSYLISVEEGEGVIRQQADKMFHVSPFMDMNMRYHFRLTHPGEEIAVAIRQGDEDGAVLNAAFTGARRPMTDATLIGAFAAYPLMTVKIIAGIHVEALKLIMKGLRLKKGAPDPASAVTLVSSGRDKERKAA